MPKAPIVSVLIPTYNYAHYLDTTIQSVLHQSFTDFELIIVDDNSKDHTCEVVQQYFYDSRVIYYKNKSRLGLVGNWNKCLELAKGQYIKFLMADDLFRTDLLQEFVAAISQNPTVSLVTCYKKEFGNRDKTWSLPFSGLQNGKAIIDHTLHNHGWLGEPSTIMFKREHLSVGQFNPKYTWLPDWEMWLRLLNVGDCYIIPKPLAYIRNHSGQVTKMVMRNYINYFEEYELYKAIQKNIDYTINISEINMDVLIKKKAIKCATAFYKELPSLYSSKSRRVIYKAGKIAFSENVLLEPFLKWWKK